MDQLGEKLGLSRQVLSRYERGEHQADYGILIKIARFFDVSVDYLLGNSTYFYPDQVASPLSDEERSFLDLFRRLSRGERVQLLAFAAGLVGKDRPETRTGD